MWGQMGGRKAYLMADYVASDFKKSLAPLGTVRMAATAITTNDMTRRLRVERYKHRWGGNSRTRHANYL